MRTNLSLDLDEVVSIEEGGVLPTWDFEIPDTHCYFANGVLVHNSIEQDADIVLLLHREDQYRKQSDPDIDPNDFDGIAELIVAKNRHGRTGIAKLLFREEYTHFVNMTPEYLGEPE